MAHKTLIDGTSYAVKGGRAIINGTGYKITKGRTIIGGTGYNIPFANRFVELMRDATLANIRISNAGTDSDSTSSYGISISASYGTNTPFYIFVIAAETDYQNPAIGPACSVYRVDSVGTSGQDFNQPVLVHQFGQMRYSQYRYPLVITDPRAGYMRYYTSRDGTNQFSWRGTTLVALEFPNFTTQEADERISSIAVKEMAARDSSSEGYLDMTVDPDDILFVAYRSAIGLSSPVGTAIFGNNTTRPTLLYYYQNQGYVRLSGDNYAGSEIYGGSIFKLAR